MLHCFLIYICIALKSHRAYARVSQPTSTSWWTWPPTRSSWLEMSTPSSFPDITTHCSQVKTVVTCKELRGPGDISCICIEGGMYSKPRNSCKPQIQILNLNYIFLIFFIFRENYLWQHSLRGRPRQRPLWGCRGSLRPRPHQPLLSSDRRVGNSLLVLTFIILTIE